MSLYYKYGTVGSSKSANLLMAEFDYTSKGRNVLLLKPSIDTRDLGAVVSRVGIQKDCISFSSEDSLIKIYENEMMKREIEHFDAIIIDEVQFSTVQQINELIALSFDNTVMCYGLKADYTGSLFPSIARLLVFANNIQEIKSMCQFCNKKSILSLRVLNGQTVYEGDVINIGDTKECEDYYIPVCVDHFFNPPIGD